MILEWLSECRRVKTKYLRRYAKTRYALRPLLSWFCAIAWSLPARFGTVFPSERLKWKWNKSTSKQEKNLIRNRWHICSTFQKLKIVIVTYRETINCCTSIFHSNWIPWISQTRTIQSNISPYFTDETLHQKGRNFLKNFMIVGNRNSQLRKNGVIHCPKFKLGSGLFWHSPKPYLSYKCVVFLKLLMPILIKFNGRNFRSDEGCDYTYYSLTNLLD